MPRLSRSPATKTVRKPYPKDAKVTKASSLPGQSGNITNCTSPIKLASLNRPASPMWAGRPPNQMQRVTAVMPRAGLTRGLSGTTALQHVVFEDALHEDALHKQSYFDVSIPTHLGSWVSTLQLLPNPLLALLEALAVCCHAALTPPVTTIIPLVTCARPLSQKVPRVVSR